MNKLIPGKQLADAILSNIKSSVEKMVQKPRLAIVLASDDESSKVYVDLKMRKAAEVGIETQLFTFDESVTKEELVKILESLNNDSAVNGILLQLPLYSHLESDSEEIVNTIHFSKDVDGLTAYQQGMCAHLVEGAILPATVEAILECLQATTNISILWKDRHSAEFKSHLRNKDIVVINDSNLIGRPLAMLLNSMGGTVTICNEFTHDIEEIIREADYVISATGKPLLFNHEHIKDGVVVIDVTSIRTADGVKGDFVIDENLLEKVSHVTPVPGGVGPLTIACLLRNVMGYGL